MPLSINYSDKILAGVNHSFSLTSSEGPPTGAVEIDGEQIPHRIVPLREPLWKVSFFVPAGSAGKTVTLRFTAGTSNVDETKDIVAE